ncbi:hypothetical protein D3C75_1112800 [compost metagenome]
MQVNAELVGQNGGKPRGRDATILPGKGPGEIGKTDVVSRPAMRDQRRNPLMLRGGDVALMKRPGVIPSGLAVGFKKQHAQFRALLAQA